MELLSSHLIGADCYSDIIETTVEFNMVSPPVTFQLNDMVLCTNPELVCGTGRICENSLYLWN